MTEFQLTHPTRGATLNAKKWCEENEISTHTPHTGCDSRVEAISGATGDFNSHTPHGVRLESATDEQRNNLDFNSHTPHGVRLVYGRNTFHQRQISTHTPHTGCDRDGAFHCLTLDGFQLTHPTRGATGDTV